MSMSASHAPELFHSWTSASRACPGLLHPGRVTRGTAVAAQTATMPSRLPELRREPTTAPDGLDVVLGAVAVAAAMVATARRALEPSFLPEPLRPTRVLAAWLRPLGRPGRVLRERLTADAIQRYDVLLPMVVDRALCRLRPTDLVRRHVDLDELVEGVDVDAIAERLDVQAVVGRVDLDAVASR